MAMEDYGVPRQLSFHVEEKDAVQREADVLSVAKQLCSSACFEGGAVADGDLSVVTLQGGLTNQLYLVKHAAHPDGAGAALVRIYGENTEILIDRAEECQVFHVLAKKGFGPQLYGLFDNGRVEEFLPSKGLEPSDMGLRAPIDNVPLIASELSRLHLLDMPLPREPHLWTFLHKFAALIDGIKLEGADDQKKLAALRLPDVRARLAQLETELPSSLNAGGATLPRVAQATEGSAERAAADFLFASSFCHNDLLAGNLLYMVDAQRMQFIDFEYGKYNFRGFDFANHFCEYAGFDFDLAKWYPSADAQRAFLLAYIRAGAAAGAGAEAEAKAKDGAAGSLAAMEALAALAVRLEDGDFADAFFKECTHWLDLFALASSYMWGYWALVQKLHSPIDFDYLDYARLRLTAIPLPPAKEASAE